MVAALVARLIAAGVPPKAAKIVLFTLLAGLIALVLYGAKCAYDKRVIENHDLKTEVIQAREDRKADEGAAEQRTGDMERQFQEQRELKNVLSQNGVDAATRKRELYRCIRLQQAARENSLEPPTCV